MTLNLLKKLAPAALALGLAGTGALAGSAPAWASVHSRATAHVAAKAKAKKPATVKAGASCTKAELGKTAVEGKSSLLCEKVGKAYKWEVKPAVKKTAAKPAVKKTAKK